MIISSQFKSFFLHNDKKSNSLHFFLPFTSSPTITSQKSWKSIIIYLSFFKIHLLYPFSSFHSLLHFLIITSQAWSRENLSIYSFLKIHLLYLYSSFLVTYPLPNDHFTRLESWKCILIYFSLKIHLLYPFSSFPFTSPLPNDHFTSLESWKSVYICSFLSNFKLHHPPSFTILHETITTHSRSITTLQDLKVVKIATNSSFLPWLHDHSSHDP